MCMSLNVNQEKFEESNIRTITVAKTSKSNKICLVAKISKSKKICLVHSAIDKILFPCGLLVCVSCTNSVLGITLHYLVRL